MSFDQSPHRQQAPPDLPHNRIQQQKTQTQDGTIPPPTFATGPMPRGEHPSYTGPSLPPPPKLPPQQQQAPITDYGRQDPYGSRQTWDRQSYSLPQTVPPPPFTSSRQYPTQLHPPEAYARPGVLPLPTDLAKNGNAPSFPVQGESTNYDPIRSEMSSHRPPPPAMPPIIKQETTQQHGYYYDRPQAAPPLMSISQLLSDAPPAESRSQQTYPSTTQKAIHPPASLSASSAASAIASMQESQPVRHHEQQQQQQQPQRPLPPLAPSSTFRNGIKNLLNSDNEDAYQMGDSDTDTDEIAAMHAKDNNQLPHHRTTSDIDGQVVPIKHEDDDVRKLPPTGSQFDSSMYENGLSFRNRATRREPLELSDDSSMEDQRIPREKTLTERTLEELQLSDDSDDEEIFNTHRDEMVQYMIDVYRRREDVIQEYEKKRTNRHKMISEHLQRIYEKRYGPELSKGLNGNVVSTASSLLLLAAKEDKEREIRRNKKAKHRHPHGVIEDDEDPEYANLLIYTSDPKLSSRKLEEKTRRVWLDIARKDIPRMNRILTRVQATRAGNCKKVAQYCQKELKRSATKNGRLSKDVQSKARRAQREMLNFWRKNEKEERELRKKAEKEALERAKQEEERREAQRQARKLNFLITQTELYSHFIGRKIKADTGEDDETAVPASERVTPEPSAAGTGDEKELDITAGEQKMEDIDFDEDDEEKLREQARRGAQNALAKQRERTRAFDEGARERRQAAGDDISMSAAQLDTMNFQDPTSMGTEEIKQPSILMCQLKSYQLKGLNWLANLYEQGINGILADEMGLGKTVQSISLMAYLAETHNIWGPFLVIAPSSTLHNWQQEISKFVPSFRALPYWGNPKDRKTLRQFWSKKQLYSKDAPFHVVITSYQLVLMDVTYFQRVKWQYMVLDEAQAIKSSSSARWKQLLGFHCRNRLLLTGTPIQNSMQELWALLHFIMPTLFDSHEEFSEWFSKDIESHAENKGTLNEHQLRRLHMILKPFMLRRIKKNVQHELSEKIEVEVYCYLTARQRALYGALKEKISVSELLEKATSLNEESMDSLMNLVMQFRKVCNHPELFERADVEAPLAFCAFSETGVALSKEPRLHCPYSSRSHIKYHIPKRLYRNGGILRVPGPESNAGFSTRYLDNLMNIWSPDYIHNSMFSDAQDSAFSFLRFVDTSAQEASYMFKQSLIARWISYLAIRDQRARRRFYVRDEESYPDAPVNTFAKLLISEVSSPLSYHVATSGSIMENFINIAYQNTHILKRFDECYIPGARSVPVDIFCSDRSFENDQNSILFEPSIRACFFGTPQYIHDSMRQEQAELHAVTRKSDGRGIMTVPVSGHGFSMMRVPAMRDLILDSGKLATLDRLLEKLKAEGHRCLIYFQMTKMIDLMEEYLAYKQYKYLRLDGSSKISDRRDMVQDWQTRPEIFIFLLSTRAGGLGINLTAADTVIFYDSDWNPTVDQQAMDRAHRLGQTKQVTVYRLITKNTIEERILQRAKQKDEIQKVVISGGEFKQVDFKPREIVSLLLDDEELDNKLQMQLKRKADEEEKKGGRTNKRSKKSNTMSEAAMDRLMSAGGDVLPEDEAATGGTSANSKKKSRIGRPRTNISFTG